MRRWRRCWQPRAKPGLLQIAAGSPLLLSVRVTYSQYRRAMEYVKIVYRADRYQYFAKLTR